jgi:hypothetical protein
MDEAGYGPVLGPLAVAAVAVEAPTDAAGADLWSVLRNAVSQRPERGERVCIADSKALHQGHGRLGRLEHHVLATSDVPLPCDFSAFASSLGIDRDHINRGEPWHRDEFPPVPLEADVAAVGRSREALRDAMERAGVRLRSVRVNLAQPWRFNALVAATDNKATALWQLSMELLENILSAFPGESVSATMDKHGGRTYYGDVLRQTFPLRQVAVGRESAASSCYHLRGETESTALEFREKADRTSLPVALASMYAKYVREVLMAQFNRYWSVRASHVAPTAGYWQDYQRWQAEMQPHLASLNLPPECYIRSR